MLLHDIVFMELHIVYTPFLFVTDSHYPDTVLSGIDLRKNGMKPVVTSIPK